MKRSRRAATDFGPAPCPVSARRLSSCRFLWTWAELASSMGIVPNRTLAYDARSKLGWEVSVGGCQTVHLGNCGGLLHVAPPL